jgi:hypothetical protein
VSPTATPGRPEDLLAAAGDVLARLWAGRPAAERAAVAADLEAAAAPPALDPATSTTIERLRGIAALSGGLSPGRLVQGLASEVAELVLDLLAPEFDRTWTTRDGWTWTLRSAARRTTIGELTAQGAVGEALAEAGTVPTDAAGEALRGIAARVGGDRPVGAGPGTGDLGSPARLQALSWAEPLGGLAGDLAEARRVAILRDVGDGYRALLDQGVFGRERELARLREFAEAPVEEAAPLPLLPLVGIGGAGKSTLLAAFVRPYLDRLVARDPGAPAVVVVDFDRLAFRAPTRLELSFELTRQLGCAFPEAGADFSVLRHQTREDERAVRTQSAGPDRYVESDSLGTSGFARAMSVLVRLHALERRPVLLVLDTVEEWQREGPHMGNPREPWDDPELQLLAWTDTLRHGCGLGGLRVVLTGRAEVAAAAARARPPIRLGDLPPEAAVGLLRAGGVPAAEAAPLAAALGGNPLTLRVGLRFFLRLGADQRVAFLAGGGTDTELDEDLRRAGAKGAAASRGLVSSLTDTPPSSAAKGNDAPSVPQFRPEAWQLRPLNRDLVAAAAAGRSENDVQVSRDGSLAVQLVRLNSTTMLISLEAQLGPFQPLDLIQLRVGSGALTTDVLIPLVAENDRLTATLSLPVAEDLTVIGTLHDVPSELTRAVLVSVRLASQTSARMLRAWLEIARNSTREELRQAVSEGRRS